MGQFRRAIAWAGLALGGAATGANADAVEDFYKGKTISFVIGVGEGGGYDLSSRLVAQHLGQFIPGKPTIVPRNMPGAGSIAAAEYVYTVAPKGRNGAGHIPADLRAGKAHRQVA